MSRKQTKVIPEVTTKPTSQPSKEKVACDRCGKPMFRMRAVYWCDHCGYKTDCCGS